MKQVKHSPLSFFSKLKWLDGKPLVIAHYRAKIFSDFLTNVTDEGRLRWTLALLLRAKKNEKSLDGVLASLFVLLFRKCLGGTTVTTVCFDEDQAAQDLDLAKKLIKKNPFLAGALKVKQKCIERKDGDGVYEILPGRDVLGSHGGKRDLLVIDEIHTLRDYSLLEALAPDPTRDSQTWITSYNSIFHRPGVPLFDFLKTAWEGTDPTMYFSYYGGDRTTDADFADKEPEERANPSMASWINKNYLAEEKRRLPSHRYRRLHLNLPGSPEGSAFNAERVMDSIDRGVRVRPPQANIQYAAFVDMSGGSADDATLSIAHLEGNRVLLDVCVNQGQRPPFDPRKAVERFSAILKTYRCFSVVGDAYAGLTFVNDFSAHGVTYYLSELTKSELYEALEPKLNAGEMVFLRRGGIRKPIFRFDLEK